jgi:hypothetical protein
MTGTSIHIQHEDVAEMFRRRAAGRGMTNAEYLDYLMTEATVNRGREELIEQTEELNRKLERIARDDT